jgi:hypothetical protein
MRLVVAESGTGVDFETKYLAIWRDFKIDSSERKIERGGKIDAALR